MLAVLGMRMGMTRMGIPVVLSEEEQEEEVLMVVLAVVVMREARVDKELLVVIGGDMGLCWWSSRGTWWERGRGREERKRELVFA